MDRMASAVVSVPFRKSDISLCLLDISDQLPRPSVRPTSHVASLALNFTPVASLSPTLVAVSLVSNTVETYVWPLDRKGYLVDFGDPLTFQYRLVLPKVCEYLDHDPDPDPRPVVGTHKCAFH